MSRGGALSTVNIQAELTRLGVKYESTGDSEVKCKCPAHDDDSPSCSMSSSSGLWKCHAAGCGASGDFISYVARLTGSSRHDVVATLSEKYDLDDAKTIDPKVVERCYERLREEKDLLSELRARGITDEMIRTARLGVKRDRITIPIYDSAGRIVNMRLYKPGAKGADKFKNQRGFGSHRLYVPGGWERLRSAESVVVCGGELKAKLVDFVLSEYSIPAVSSSGGEGNWRAEFTKELAGKHVFILYDVDRAGRHGAAALAAQVAAHVRTVRDVELPLDPQKYPHGDVNDWFGAESASSEDLMRVINESREWMPPVDSSEELTKADTLHVTLHDSASPETVGKAITVRAVVTAIDTTPYLVPRTVRVACERDQKFCIDCPVYPRQPDEAGLTQLTVRSRSPGILQAMGVPTGALRDAVMGALKMPQCKAAELTYRDYFVVHDVRLSPTLEEENSTEHVMRPAAVVADSLESNATYDFEGVVLPHPRNQQAVLLSDGAQPSDDSLDEFELTSEQASELKDVFSCNPDPDAVQARLDSIYTDFEANVTRIFKRQALHTMLDLAWHSPLHIKFDNRTEKGWAEILIVGDSAQGKSETALRMMQHYGLGQRVECKNASVAGLIGGLQKIDGRYFVVWGRIPTNDRRLVILEEVKGASTEVLARMTDMRSSGIAELPKIEKRRTHARTRLIWISNPRSDRPISAYNFGIEAVKELIGSMEDVRRFDAVLIVSSTQINAEEINALTAERSRVEHRYTSDLCKRLIMWAWTRNSERVSLTDAARRGVMEAANRMCSKYSDAMPIVDRGSMRLKLARLAAAVAARTFSTNGDSTKLIIKPGHVQWVESFLDNTYSEAACGYGDFSRAMSVVEKLADPKKVMSKVYSEVPYPSEFIEKMLNTDRISLIDICDWCGWDRQQGMKVMSFLVRKNALVRIDRDYRKTPGFIEVLKSALASGEANRMDRPFADDEDEFGGV